MKKVYFLNLLLYLANPAFSAEEQILKKTNWQFGLNYAKLYNFRYARHSGLKDKSESYFAYLDSCHIPTYTNQLGFTIQRKIWKFIHLQSGISYGRRGYLGTYEKKSGIRNEIHIIPKKALFIPLNINFSYTLKDKIFLQGGFGKEVSVWVQKEPTILPYPILKQTSSGFFGFRWNKNRVGNETIVNDRSFTNFGGINNVLSISIGFKFSESLLAAINGNYSFRTKYYQVTTYDSYLNHTYEVRPYIFAYGVSFVYCY